MEKKALKRSFNKLGLAIIAQQAIYELLAFIIIFTLKLINKKYNCNLDISNGTIMIIIVSVGFIPFLVLRGKEFINYDLKVKNKSINIKAILLGILLVLGLNYISSFITLILTTILGSFGASIETSQEVLNFSNSTSMIIYAVLIGPVFEEFVYRGAVLRYLEKYGTKFAIIVSAVMFGMMHGNIIQIPSAILVGIVFGFIAKKYSIKLSILLHIINNAFAVSVDFVDSQIVMGLLGLFVIAIIVATIAIIVVYIVNNRYKIKNWLYNNKIEKGYIKYYFSSITIIILTIYFIFITVFLNKLF